MVIDLDIADYVAVLSESLSGVALGAYNGKEQNISFVKLFRVGKRQRIDELEY